MGCMEMVGKLGICKNLDDDLDLIERIKVLLYAQYIRLSFLKIEKIMCTVRNENSDYWKIFLKVFLYRRDFHEQNR